MTLDSALDCFKYSCMNFFQRSFSDWLDFANPYPGQSTSRQFAFSSGTKVKSLVFPGVFDV